MTRKNNFTQAPEGQPDIEFVGFQDLSISQHMFSENFEILQFSGYRSSTIAYYIDHGNVPGADDIKFTVKGDKAAKVSYLEGNTIFDESEIETWSEDDIDSEIISLSECNLLNWITDSIENIDGLEFVPSKNLIKLVTRGYSQGDYAEVYYCPDDLEKAWGNAPDQSELQTTFDNLFWDAPYYACMTINGEEYNLFDMPDYNEYEWDADKFAAYVSKESGIDIAILEPLIPQNLEY